VKGFSNVKVNRVKIPVYTSKFVKEGKTMTKYKNKKIEYDGIVFDSKKEMKRFQELKLLEKAGAITELRRQVKYILIPAQYETYERYGKNGNRLKDGRRCIEKECSYIADFTYWDVKKCIDVVEDTKGFRTTDYVIKRKLMLYVHGIKIKEI
jgi:hypothetical protein